MGKAWLLTAASSQACVGLFMPSCLTSNWPTPWPCPLRPVELLFLHLFISSSLTRAESIGRWPVIFLRQACQVSLIGPLSAAALTWLKPTVGYCLNSLWLFNKNTNSNPFANSDSINASPCQELSLSSFISLLLFSIYLLDDTPHAILLSFEMCFNRAIVISHSEDIWKPHMSPDVTNCSGLYIRLSFSSYLSVRQVSAHMNLNEPKAWRAQ